MKSAISEGRSSCGTSKREIKCHPSPNLSPKDAQSYDVLDGERGFALENFEIQFE